MGLGNITREHTAWCFLCEHWEQEGEHSKSRFIKWLKRGGWKLVAGKWVCPKCVARHGRYRLADLVNSEGK